LATRPTEDRTVNMFENKELWRKYVAHSRLFKRYRE